MPYQICRRFPKTIVATMGHSELRHLVRVELEWVSASTCAC